MNNELEQLPPTAAFVYYVLERADRPLTKDEIADRTNRPEPSIEKALQKLRREDLVSGRPKLGDGRTHVYYPEIHSI